MLLTELEVEDNWNMKNKSERKIEKLVKKVTYELKFIAGFSLLDGDYIFTLRKWKTRGTKWSNPETAPKDLIKYLGKRNSEINRVRRCRRNRKIFCGEVTVKSNYSRMGEYLIRKKMEIEENEKKEQNQQ